MSPALSNERLARLSDWATAEFGLRFPPDRWSELGRGVASAALELGIPDLAGWSEQLVTGEPASEHLAAVANHLTISETYFFRHHETFEALEKEILPKRIAERKRHARPLRLWSAGCASGEEPYSIAILLRQRFPDLRPDSVAIVATDINARVLERAAAGVYSEWSFRDVPEWVKAPWFQRRPNGRYEIALEIRRMVRFTALNLAAAFYPVGFGDGSDFDVILCRNVLMYFSGEWQDRIIRHFVAALAPEGWLIVGPCDITAAQCAALHLRPSSAGIYQKTSAARGMAEVATVPIVMPSPMWPVMPEPIAAPAQWAQPIAPMPPPSSRPADMPSTDVELTAAATEGEVASARAQSHANRGELDAALAACDEALASDKTNASFHYLRACILQEQNRLPEAAEAFRRVLFLEPHSVMAEFALGCLAAKDGQRAQARHHFHVVLRMLGSANRGDAVPGGESLTVARLRAVVEHNLSHDAA